MKKIRLAENNEKVRKVSILIEEIEGLQGCRAYFKNEDFNIILEFRKYLKNIRMDLKKGIQEGLEHKEFKYQYEL